MKKIKKNRKLNKKYLVVLIFFLSSNFVLFQNYIGNPNINDASLAALSARAFTERSLMELNQARPASPEANALLIAVSFGVGIIGSVYAGRYDAAVFSAAGINVALQKYDRYLSVNNIAQLGGDDQKLVQELKTSIAPFLTAITMPTQPFNFPLDSNTQLQVTQGQMSFITKDDKGNAVFVKKYDYININSLLSEMATQAKRKPFLEEKNVIKFPKLLSDLDDDPSDRADNIRQITDTIMSELEKDHEITVVDMYNNNLIRDPFNPTIADVAPLEFDENYNPIRSKITFEYKSSFNPAVYSEPPSTSTTISSTDPYDATYYDFYSGEIVTTPPGTNPGTGGGSGSGGSSGTGGTDYISHPDPNYDSYDNQGTPFTTPNPSTDSGSSGSVN